MPGIALPPALMARAFMPAWGIAVVAHLVLVALALVGPPAAPPPEEQLVRMVFVEPAPPPPAPLGRPGGAGPEAALVEPPVASPAVEPKKRPTVATPERLRVVKAKPKAKPRRVEEPKPQVAAVDVAPGVSAGVAGGQADGVVGGVTGGVAGGVVGGTGTDPIPVRQVAQPPVLLHRVQPKYPQQARRQQIHGLVLLEAVLDRDGRVEPSVKVIESIPMLDDEAIAAVRRWRFRPARSRSGEPLRVIVEIPIRFVLR
jgi:protein TonB